MFDIKKNRKPTRLFKVYIPLLLGFILMVSCGEKSEIRKTCQAFIDGRIALRAGDSIPIKRVTEDSLYTLLMLHKQYENLAYAPVIRPSLRMYVKSIEIEDNCAVCEMSAQEYYNINLCKDENNTWVVKGENWKYGTSAKITKARKKLADFKIHLKERPAQDSVLASLNTFLKGVKSYFKTQDSSILEQYSDQATIDFVKRLYTYSVKNIDQDELAIQMAKPDYTLFSINFNKDEKNKVIGEFYKEPETRVHLIKTDSMYIVTGFNDVESAAITNQLIKEKYPEFLRSLKLIKAKKYWKEGVFE